MSPIRQLVHFHIQNYPKTTSLPRLVTPAKAHDMAAQLQGMFETPLGFVSAKIYTDLTAGLNATISGEIEADVGC